MYATSDALDKFSGQTFRSDRRFFALSATRWNSFRCPAEQSDIYDVLKRKCRYLVERCDNRLLINPLTRKKCKGSYNYACSFTSEIHDEFTLLNNTLFLMQTFSLP